MIVCFGAMSFDTLTGERTVHLADAAILCTGDIQKYGGEVLQGKEKIQVMDIV